VARSSQEAVTGTTQLTLASTTQNVLIIFCMYSRPKTMNRSSCSGQWCSSVGVESNEFSRYRVIPVVQETSVQQNSIWGLLHQDLFSNNILFFEWVYCLFQKSLKLQPNPNYFNQEISLPCLWLNCLIRKRKLKIGDKTAYWMRCIWWDPEGFH